MRVMKKMITGMVVAVAAVFTITLAGCAKSEPQEAKEVLLLSLVEEYGGRENLEKLNAYATRWRLSSPMRGEGIDTRYIVFPDKLRVELGYADSSEVRLLSGDLGYRTSGASPALKADGPRLDSMKLQKMRLYTPLNLLEKKDSLTMTEEGGEALLTLVEDGLTTVYTVNSATKRIEKVVGKVVVDGNEMEFRTEYSDFKKVEGVLMPHKEVKYAGGFNTATMTLQAVRIGEEMAPSLFEVSGAVSGGTPEAEVEPEVKPE